jgi:macrolide transport system ATP-binding/permease protein
MRTLRAWLLRFAGLFGRNRIDQEISEEIETHLQMQIEDNLHSGMGADQARMSALVKLGNGESARQAYRERSTLPFLENLAQDLRFTLRQLYRRPGFTTTAVLVLALGIGASVSIFAFVDAALIRPLPYENPSRLVGVYENTVLCPHCNLSYLDYLDWKKNNQVFRSFDVWGYRDYLLKTPAGAESSVGVRTSPGFFRTLGVRPVLGRDFYPGEGSSSPANTALLSYSTWQRRFGEREDAIGQTVTLDDTTYTIVGVLPKTFQFAPRGNAEFWVPLSDHDPCEQRRFCHSLYGIARLKEGVSVQSALADMASIAGQLEMQYPDSNHGQGAAVVPLSNVIVGDLRPVLLVLQAGAGLLLLIADLNIAGLLLVRSESRKQEIAVRGALGATSIRLLRQFISEAVVLVVVGSFLGMVLADGMMRLILKLIPNSVKTGMPYLQGLGLNGHCLALTAAASLLGIVLFSIASAPRLFSANLQTDLSEGGRGSANKIWRRLGTKLVVVELATAFVLLVAAGLFGKSLHRLLNVDLNFRPDHLATLEIEAPQNTYASDEKAVGLGREMVDRISALPGVDAVGHTSNLPLSCNCDTTVIRIAGHPWKGERIDVPMRIVSPLYFKTLQAKLLNGRYFAEADDSSKPAVIIINRTLAKRFFPDEDPIGKKVGNLQLSPQSLREIVGVVDDLHEGALDSEVWPAVYLPFNQAPGTSFAIVVRSRQEEQSLLPTLTQVVQHIHSGIGVKNVTTMNQRLNESQTAYLHRSSTWLVGGFAGFALVLGVVGLYGVIAYSVSQRTREIGIRMALGAQRSAVYRLILREAAWLAGLGTGIGLLGSAGMAMLVRTMLFGVPLLDGPTYAAVAALLAVFALLASYIPARQAARINAIAALRAE